MSVQSSKIGGQGRLRTLVVGCSQLLPPAVQGRRLLLACFLLVGLAAVPALATPLDDKIQAFDAAQVQTADAVSGILRAGLSESRSAAAFAAVGSWLAANPGSDPTLLFRAGRAAEYAGEWSEAVSFYRKLLQNKSVNGKLAAQAVPAVYRLLISHMRKENAAYLFMRQDGNRLRGYGRAKQFDHWFLQQALRRNDLSAVAERLAVIHGGAADSSEYDEFMKSLLRKLESFEVRDEETVEALDRLAKVSRKSEFKLRWDWINAVSRYNSEALKTNIKREKPDKELLTEPLKAARALVAADPVEGAAFVVKGWSRWNQGDTPTFFRFVHVHRDLKSQVFIDALQRLSAEKAKKMLQTGAKGPRGRWVSVAGFISPTMASALVIRFPAIFNALDAPSVALFDKEMTVEKAKTLAPHLARNPHRDAALLRAFAAAGTATVKAMVPVMMKSERWRFGSAKSVVDTVWNSGADRNGANHGELVKQYEKQGARHDQLSKQISKDADSKSRLAAFAAIYKELRGKPATPGLLALWHALFTQAPHADLDKMLQTLVSDFVAAPPAALDLQKYLLGQAVQKSSFGNNYSSLTFGPDFRGGWDRWGYQNVRKALPGLAAHLGTLLRQQMEAGSLSEPIFGMWLHCVDPSTPDAKALFKELVKSKAYAVMDSAYHRMAAHKLLFGEAALIEESPTDPRIVSRELLALPNDATAKEVETALKAVIAKVTQASKPVSVVGVAAVAKLPELKGEIRKLALSLFAENAPLGDYPHRQGYEPLVTRLVTDIQKTGEWGGIEAYVANFWRSARHPLHRNRHPVADVLTNFASAALDNDAPSVASTVARIGLQTHGVPGLNRGDARYGGKQRAGSLQQVSGKAGLVIGMFEIPVDETHPDYPIYKSNAEFAQGNLDSAWELYKKNAERLVPPATRDRRQTEDGAKPLLHKMPVVYSLWLLHRNMEVNGTDRAENLIRALMIWSRQAEGTFSPEQEADLRLAYADLAFRDGKLPTARAWFQKVADAREYRGSEMQMQAILGMVRVDRAAKNFGSAMTELDALMNMPNPQARIKAHFARGQVLMDQENYKEAFDEMQTVLRREPAHADALILRGKIQYQMRKLVEASEIELGVSQQHKIIVPGETLKINLHDPTLSISGVGVDIEVEVTAKSGDKERVMLYQFGDDKQKFRAEIPTALAAAVPGDKTLQVLGVDEIRYGYSERFRAKMKDLPPDPEMAIGVAADAYLTLSAGAFPPREGERRLDIEELGLSTAQKALGMRSVRPGNPIYLRVIDADKSKTAESDQLSVSLHTSSGDVIRNLQVQETGPYTGEFEATIPTSSAQAMAFASESAPGRDPNMAISSTDYPGWQGKPGDKHKRRVFGVDLNDNVALKTMALGWTAGDSELTHFVLQTSMNGKDWSTRARYPKDEAPWDGRPQLSSFPTYGRNAMSVSVPEGQGVPRDWREKMDLISARGSISYVAKHVPSLAAMKPELASGGHPGYSVLMRYRALFYQPAAAIRRFRLQGYPAADDKGNIKTVFLIDGQPADEESGDPLTIERELKPGLHEIQVWCHEGRSQLEKRKPALLCDTPGEQELQPCPKSMFDPATFPEGVQEKIPQPATVAQAEDGDGLTIAFGDHSQARLARLVIFGFKGVAPEIRFVRLTNRGGETLLPVKQDFKKLRENKQLEVLPGDRITARYEDDVPATPKRHRHERHLRVAFNTATITASFLNFERNREGERIFVPEPIRRFRFSDDIAVIIDDADMDSSPKRDTVEFTVVTSAGDKATMKAIETDEHSGLFRGRMFPVAGKPQRTSEIQLPEGGTLTVAYRDMENLDPGIPAERVASIEHAQYSRPVMGLYNVASEALPPREIDENSGQQTSGPERFHAMRALEYEYVGENDVDGLQGVLGGALRFDIVVPHQALARSSVIHAYAHVDSGQTDSAGKADQPFNINLPGTLKLTGELKRKEGLAPTGYRIRSGAIPPTNEAPLEEGRFAFSVPLILADKPERSFAGKDAASVPASVLPDGLAVQAGDRVRIGYAYKDENDNLRWKTAAVKVLGHAFLDVMNDSYNADLASAYVGEKVYVRVLGRNLDRGPNRDETAVQLSASSGADATFKLRETEPHSGVFKGVFALSYADQELPSPLPPVELNGLPVRYGDDVLVSFPATDAAARQSRTVRVNRGADGEIKPFTKRFTGDEMAVKTTFTLSECFFELAKKHRKMQRESLARREIGHARKLLTEAIATHRDDDLKAHAEYLLGNLAQEYADLAENDAAKLPMYQDALARFAKIPGDYPETEFAPKGQFKTALVYEKMGEIENAVEEYAKLAYKYPDSELIPKVMARLGGYFKRNGQVYKDQADALREKEDTESRSEVIRLDELARPEFIKAAQVFAKLQERFPGDDLAGLAGLSAAQNYMRAQHYSKAIGVFETVINNESYDARTIRAQALFWSGLCHERLRAAMAVDNWRGRGAHRGSAYRIYRRITFDFPDSKWAKLARGRLADRAFESMIEKEAKQRSRLLEQLKEQR